MNIAQPAETALWPLWRKIIFRFFFVYLTLQIAPWTWLTFTDFVVKYYYNMMDWMVDKSNAYIFHVRKVLVPVNGSGDTSYGWAQLWMFLVMAIIGCIIWTIADRKRSNYVRLNYWLCLFSRYYVCFIAFSYGIIKLFDAQMPFPNLHQLATPLGDYLPMRLSWMFIGYSAPYQTFSGVMEIVAGMLLLFRRTTTLGVMVAAAVFMNVMMLNLCYDIPVKIFSMQLVFTCLFLLANESKRIICFFLLNKPANTCSIYHFNYNKKWMRITRIVFKALFVLFFVGSPLWTSSMGYLYPKKPVTGKEMPKNGVYTVTQYRVNKTDLPITDTSRWPDFILDNGAVSIKSNDTAYARRYGRAYFGTRINIDKHTFGFTRVDSLQFTLNYTLPDSNTIKLAGKRGNDSLFVELKRTKRHFQLTERQFHWLSEKNR